MQLFYTVRSGEYPYLIASRWKIPLHTLIAANNIAYPYIIYPGQQLSIPPGISQYRIKKGDTLYSISNYFGIPAQLIAKANNLNPPYPLKPDEFLTIPQGLPYYVVREGDTLYNIALRYNVMNNGVPNIDIIIRVNKLSDETVTPGMRLKIPYSHHSEKGLIAYASNKSGNYDIWLYNLKNRVDYRLTDSLGLSSTTPFWSPDGRRIAFVGKNDILYVININTKSLAKIDQVNPYTRIGWSPDGKFLAYGRDREIIIYNLERHRTKRIKVPRAQDVQFFPDGGNLLFQSYDSSNISQIYAIGIDGRNKRQLTKNEMGQVNFLRSSPNGKFITYTLPGASISIINIMELSTGKIIEAPGGPLSKNYYPVWSPDSSRILYSSTTYDDSGYYSLIKVFNPAKGKDFIWTVSDCYLTPLDWSSDGGKFIYITDCEEKSSNKIWLLNISNPAPVKIIEGGDIVSLAFAP